MQTQAFATTLTAIALLAPLVAIVLPEPVGSARTGAEFGLYMYVTFATTMVFITAAVLFLRGLGDFTAKLKRAYGWLCLGLIFYGLAQFQIPLLTLIGQAESLWTRSGLIAIPFLVALISLYWGMRQFARLLGVKSIWTSFWFVLLVSTVAAVGSIFLPHFGEASAEVAFDSAVAFSTWGMGLISASTILAIKTKRIASVIYTNALAWMMLAFTGIGVVGLHYIVSILLIGDRADYSESAALLTTYLFAGFIFIRAAYAFNVIGEQPASSATERNFFGRPLTPPMSDEATSIDIVVYAGQLASNPQAVEGILDDLRVVTAIHQPSQLTAEDHARLKQVYLNLETYLITKEPIRKFTQQSLRSEIAAQLHLNKGTTATFWSAL